MNFETWRTITGKSNRVTIRRHHAADYCSSQLAALLEWLPPYSAAYFVSIFVLDAMLAPLPRTMPPITAALNSLRCSGHLKPATALLLFASARLCSCSSHRRLPPYSAAYFVSIFVLDAMLAPLPRTMPPITAALNSLRWFFSFCAVERSIGMGMKKVSVFIILIALAGLVFSPSTLAAQSTPVATTRVTEEGFASWYGADFQGRKTANGEIFDTNLLTAAHKTLPFGTIVRVTDLYTGKTVMVRINDRGPFIEGRNIDLSRAAAEQLGIISAGISKVLIEAEIPVANVATATTVTTIVPSTIVSTTEKAIPGSFATIQPNKISGDSGLSQVLHTVQVASFGNTSNADKLVALLRQRDLPANLEVSADTGKTRVVLRGITEPKLQNTLAELRELGFQQVIVRPQTP